MKGPRGGRGVIWAVGWGVGVVGEVESGGEGQGERGDGIRRRGGLIEVGFRAVMGGMRWEKMK